MVEGAALEKRYTVTPYRGFESRPLRHNITRISFHPPFIPKKPKAIIHPYLLAPVANNNQLILRKIFQGVRQPKFVYV